MATQTVEDEETDTVEQRAERIVEVEERLKDQNMEDRQSETRPASSTTIDLSTSHISNAPVVGIDKTGYSCKITCLVDGEEKEFELSWPSDTTDPEEPLVRLCNHVGMPIDRIGDLDSVPVITIDHSDYLYIPHPRRRSHVELVLPTGHSADSTHIRFKDRLLYRLGNIGAKLGNTPLVDLNASSRRVRRRNTLSINEKPALLTLGLLSMLTILPFSSLSGFLADPILYFLAFLMFTTLAGAVYALIGCLCGIFLAGDLEIQFEQ